MLKVLVLSNMYPSNSKPYSGIFVKNQFEYLKNDDQIDIELYALPRKFESSLLKKILKYLNFYIFFSKYFFKKFDIIHIHFFGYHYFLGVIYKLINPKTKLILTVHGTDTKNFSKKIFKFFTYFLDHIIAVGSDQANKIKLNVSKKISVIPAGIDSKIFYFEEKLKKYDFIFIGSFYDIKGVDILIKAIQILDNPKLKFCFVGSGKYSNEINLLKKKYNIFHLDHLVQENLRTLLNQSKFLVLPSRGDSFGLVISEAMFCGTPVIVSNNGGMTDQVKNNLNGYIIKKNSPKELSLAMIRAIKINKKEYLRISNNALNSNKVFSLSNTIKKLKKIYEL